MQYAPKITILSSATLPNPNDVPTLVSLFRIKKPDCQIININPEKAKVPAQIYVNFGKKYYPHQDCKSREDLKKVIKAIKKNPFISRM